MIFGKTALSLHVEHEIATTHEFDYEEQTRWRLEAGVQAHQKRMIWGRLKHVFLCLHPIDVLIVCHQGLLDHLHGVNPLSTLQLHHQDLRVGTTADHPDQLEVIQRVLPLHVVRSIALVQCIQWQFFPFLMSDSYKIININSILIVRIKRYII